MGDGVPKARIARDLGCSRRVLYDALTGAGAYAGPLVEAPALGPADERG